MDHIFITGATGLIGSRVVQTLTERGMKPACLVRPNSDTSTISSASLVHGDLLDPASLLDGMHGASQVIHLAAVADWRNINKPVVWKTIVEGTRNVLTAARETGVRRVVHISSSAAIDGTLQPRLLDETSTFSLPRKGFLYAHAKREAESICQQFQLEGLPVVIVNPAETYGPKDHRLTTAGNLLRFAKGRTAWVTRGGTGVVHADDVAAGILLALEHGHPGQRYILSAENLTFASIARFVRETLCRPCNIMEAPAAVVRILAALERTLRLPLGLNPDMIPYATRYWFMDSQKARQHLGWRPRPGSEAITETTRWLQETHL